MGDRASGNTAAAHVPAARATSTCGAGSGASGPGVSRRPRGGPPPSRGRESGARHSDFEKVWAVGRLFKLASVNAGEVPLCAPWNIHIALPVRCRRIAAPRRPDDLTEVRARRRRLGASTNKAYLVHARTDAAFRLLRLRPARPHGAEPAR